MVAVIDKHASSLPACLGSNPRVAVVGLGDTGVSAVRFLHGLGVECLVTDSRPHPPGLEEVRKYQGVSVFTGELRADVLSWASHILVSPGLSLADTAIRSALEHGAALISDIDLFAQMAQAPVIAVTGSNGKSTVTCLVAEMARQAGLRVRAGGNLGTPALDLLDPECELYVLELSSFQLERTRRFRPDAGAVLNVSPDHLDRHPDVEEYAAIKAKLLQWSDWRVANRDDPLIVRLAEDRVTHGGLGSRRVSVSGVKGRWVEKPDRWSSSSIQWFSLENPDADYALKYSRGEPWLARRGRPLLAVSELALSGRHNQANALAALALAEAGGVALEPSLEVLRTFTGLPHRMQEVAKIDEVLWINDSKGTNVGATEAAISGLEGPIVLLAGGVGKGADFSCLRPAVAAKVKMAVLFGRDRHRLAQALEPVTRIVQVKDLETAMKVARKNARPGDTVLLSPACASLDQFENYRSRGNRFESLVRQWQSTE